jgi:ubiquinone/menaquinone biosynthesis C-methylase UbiE
MASMQREFWSKLAQKYDRIVDLQIGPMTRSMVLERVAKEDRLGNLVEFGCGTGFYTEVLAGKADSVLATDLSPGMLALAQHRVKATNVTFQTEDCQKSSLSDRAFDTAFLSLVIHFTDPAKTLAEMHRILKPGGALIIANLDPRALKGPDRVRCLIRVLYHGFTGYRLKPPKGFGRNVMTEKQVCELLEKSGFRVVTAETVRNTSRSSNIPIEYIRAVMI